MNVRRYIMAAQSAVAVWALCATCAFAQTNLEFIQWWEPELPAGALRSIMDEFEAKNPGIKVTPGQRSLSPTRDQIVVGAASGTLSDVVGLDGAWVNDLAKAGRDRLDRQPADRGLGIRREPGRRGHQGRRRQSYMFPVASFVYPVFVNLDLLEGGRGREHAAEPTEFVDAARKLTDAAKNQYGWVLPLSLESPNGIQNDVMSWVWASGKSMLKDGQPDLTNADVVGTLRSSSSRCTTTG